MSKRKQRKRRHSFFFDKRKELTMLVAFYKHHVLVLSHYKLAADGTPIAGDVMNGAWSFKAKEGIMRMDNGYKVPAEFVCSRVMPYSEDYNRAIFDAYQMLTPEEKAKCGCWRVQQGQESF
jgi:hypothetical protein